MTSFHYRRPFDKGQWVFYGSFMNQKSSKLRLKSSSIQSFLNSPSRLIGIALSCAFLFGSISARAATPESIGFSFVERSVSDPSGMMVQAFDELTGDFIPDAQIQVSDLVGHTDLKVVHVRRTGYSGVSVYGIRKGALAVMLKPDTALGTSAVSSGELRNYLPYLSGHVDGGIILRTLGVSDLLNLNVDSLLSPLKDEIRALGRRLIPSNIVFPRQTVSVIVKLDKPLFRLPMSTGRYTGLVGAQAAIRVGDLLGLPADPDPVDFANLLKLRKIGWTERLNPGADFYRDIPLTHELDQNLLVKIQNIPYAANIFALSLVDLNDDRQALTVADVKGIRNGTYDAASGVSLSLMSPKTLPIGAVSYVIGAAISEDGRQISASILDATSKRADVKNLLVAPRIGVAPKDGMDVQTLSQTGLSAVMIQEKLSTRGARSHRAFVLPEAGRTRVDFQTIFPGVALDQVGLSQMEFQSLDARSVDGVSLSRLLKRFTYSISGS